MHYSYFCGVDISKNHLDLHMVDPDGDLVFTGHCRNTEPDLDQLLDQIEQKQFNNVLFCAESTSIYGFTLQQLAGKRSLQVWFEHPGQISACSGIKRGKTDPIDAKRIASYTRRYIDKVKLWVPADAAVQQLGYLQSERALLVADRAKYVGQLKDQKDHMPPQAYQAKSKRLSALIATFDQQIERIDRQIKQAIASSPKITRHNQLLQSIPGVGPRLALAVIVLTKNFTCFKNARAFCCHSGIAPFYWHSGINNKSQARISNRADKRMKSLLHMGALAAIRTKGELSQYYQRKCEEGKAKMSVVNAIRAKLVYRMFAVVKKDQMYHPDIPRFA